MPEEPIILPSIKVEGEEDINEQLTAKLSLLKRLELALFEAE